MKLHLIDGRKRNSPLACRGGRVGIQKGDGRAARLIHFVIGAAVLCRQVVAGILHGSLGRCRTLIPTLHIVSPEVSPRPFRVDVVEGHIVLLLGAGGVIQRLNVRTVVGAFDDVGHATVCQIGRLRAQFRGGHALLRHLLGGHHILEIKLRHHVGRVGQLDEVVLEGLIELEIILPRQNITQVEVALGAIERDLLVLNQVALAGHIADDRNLLTIQVQLNEIVGRTRAGHAQTLHGWLHHHGHGIHLALLIGAFLGMIGQARGTIDAHHLTRHVEARANALVEALHQNGIVINEVL